MYATGPDFIPADTISGGGFSGKSSEVPITGLGRAGLGGVATWGGGGWRGGEIMLRMSAAACEWEACARGLRGGAMGCELPIEGCV